MDTNAPDQIGQALIIAKAGDTARARSMLADIVAREPNNARAWYLLSQLNPRAQAMDCLREVLRIDPQNAKAKERLAQLQNESQREQADWAERDRRIEKLKKETKGWNFLANTTLVIYVIVPVLLICACSIGWFILVNAK